MLDKCRAQEEEVEVLSQPSSTPVTVHMRYEKNSQDVTTLHIKTVLQPPTYAHYSLVL